MDKEFYDKYGKEFHCVDCCMLDVCMKKNEPLYGRCWEQFAKDKIADLEAKLAESEKKIKRARETRQISDEFRIKAQKNQLKEKEKAIVKLKQQLAEKDQAIEGLQEINQSLGQTCNNDAKEIERLIEKENLLNLIVDGYYTPTNIVERQIREQNQKAIAELENTKENMNNLYREHKPIYFDLLLIRNTIDQQIKELKGEK